MGGGSRRRGRPPARPGSGISDDRGPLSRHGPALGPRRGVRLAPIAAELVSTCPHPLASRTVLDAGAGTGAASEALAAQRARPIAMDLSFDMLAWNGADRPHRPAERPDRGTRAGARPSHRRRRYQRDRGLDRIARGHLPPPGGHLPHRPRPRRRRGRGRPRQVHGIEHLHVADASIMPAIPSANTNLPAIMIAERVASWIATERHEP